MNPLFLYFASGESLYPGAVLLFVAALSRHWPSRWLTWPRSIAIWVALAFIVMACPPFDWTVDVVFATVVVLWLIVWGRAAQTLLRARVQILGTSVVLVLLVTLSTSEFFHRKVPVIRGQFADHLVVIGDSISSGLNTRVQPWPTVMQQATGTEVKNLSMPGAMMSDGLAMAERISPVDHLILIELGGNDLIADEPAEGFARELESVLTKLDAAGRTVVMFELPLLPNRIAYGQIQRRLAAKYRVWLIPKRCLAVIIASPDATSDGLHLTDVGSQRMALLVAQILSPVLRMNPTTPATHS